MKRLAMAGKWALVSGMLITFYTGVAAAEPGYIWENSMEISAMGMKMPMQTTQICQPKEWREPPGAQQQDSNCKMSDLKQSPSKVSWKVKCSGPDPVTGSGEMNFQGDTRYSGVVRMSMKEGETLMKLSGKRLGPCEYSKPQLPR